MKKSKVKKQSNNDSITKSYLDKKISEVNKRIDRVTKYIDYKLEPVDEFKNEFKDFKNKVFDKLDSLICYTFVNEKAYL